VGTNLVSNREKSQKVIQIEFLLSSPVARESGAAGRALAVPGCVNKYGKASNPDSPDHKSKEEHEGTTVGKADVRKMQDYPPKWAGACDLPESTTQAASGVSFGSNCRG
jgi:hypothetical protein